MRFMPFALAAFIAASGTAIAADPPPVRTLVFHFTYGTSSNLEVLNSGIDPTGGAAGGTGVTNFTASEGDQGTITVDVLGERSDKSLVVRVNEQGQKDRRAGPAVCIVWPTTAASCEQNLTVLPEEFTIVRLLAPGFVDPAKIDEKNHWAIDSKEANNSIRIDFRIRSNVEGILKIDSDGSTSQHTAQNVTTTTSEKIDYDVARDVPVRISEFTVERAPQSMGQYETQRTEITAQLSSDSLGKQPH